jgi:DNA-binding response OmpR family regulator
MGSPMQRILIIDDDHAIRASLQLVLEREGYEVVCAVDGGAGIRMFERASPQMVITDLIMPNKEGIETIMELRSRDATMPILAISGGARIHNTDFLQIARRLGANESLAKPFTSKELVAAVRRLLPPEDGTAPRA